MKHTNNLYMICSFIQRMYRYIHTCPGKRLATWSWAQCQELKEVFEKIQDSVSLGKESRKLKKKGI